MFNILRGGASLVLAASLTFSFSMPHADAQDRVDIDIVFERMAETLSNAKAFSVHAEKLFDVVLVAGPKVQYAAAFDVAVRRPDRFYISYVDDISSKELWYDGKSLTIQDHLSNVHTVVDASATIEETTDMLSEKYGLLMPLGELFSSDSYTTYSKAAGKRYYLGIHDVDGRAAHHILFAGERADWQLWIAVGEVPLPLKVVVERIDTFGLPQQTIVLSEWDLEADLPDDTFEAEISEGSTRAEFLAAAKEN